jgi:hypothetical protein
MILGSSYMAAYEGGEKSIAATAAFIFFMMRKDKN